MEMKQKRLFLRYHLQNGSFETILCERVIMMNSRKLLKAFFPVLLSVMLIFCTLPAFADGDAATTAVTATTTDTETAELYAVVRLTQYGRVNLREGPSAKTGRITTVDPGTKAKVLKVEENWSLIELDEHIGYMSNFYLDFYYNGEPLLVPPVTPVAPDYTTETSYVDPYYEPATWPRTEYTTMYVNTDNGGKLNMRIRPDLSAPIAHSYEVGTAVTVLNRSATWAYVMVGRRTGFMMLKYLSYTKPIIPEPTPIGTGTVVHPRGSFVYLRSSRNTDSTANVLAKVPSGSFIEILSWDVWYCKIRYNGIVGYMVTSYIQGN